MNMLIKPGPGWPQEVSFYEFYQLLDQLSKDYRSTRSQKSATQMLLEEWIKVNGSKVPKAISMKIFELGTYVSDELQEKSIAKKLLDDGISPRDVKSWGLEILPGELSSYFKNTLLVLWKSNEVKAFKDLGGKVDDALVEQVLRQIHEESRQPSRIKQSQEELRKIFNHIVKSPASFVREWGPKVSLLNSNKTNASSSTGVAQIPWVEGWFPELDVLLKAHHLSTHLSPAQTNTSPKPKPRL